eukprot:scaffold152300_cov31-Tisochrysis_lutea.AAC.1
MLSSQPRITSVRMNTQPQHTQTLTWSALSSSSLRSSVCWRACLDTSMWYACMGRHAIQMHTSEYQLVCSMGRHVTQV